MNVIQIPFEHKMFKDEISGELENFIYDEFSLIYTKKDDMVLGFTVFFKPKISGTEIYLVRLGTEWIENISYKIELDDKTNSGFVVYCNSFDKKYTEIGNCLAEIVLITMIYIMNAPRERVKKPKTQNIFNGKKSESKRKNEEKIYLLDEIVDYVNENGLNLQSSGTHKINCPCWSVRGHYRHYKSGKVVFIKNYEKGKEKGKINPKDKFYGV